MVHYGTKEEWVIEIPNVDHDPEIAGIKLSYMPAVLSISSVPLWFNCLGLSVMLFLGTVVALLWAARREAEGRPVTLNSRLVAFTHRIPSVLRNGLFPSIASVTPFSDRYRR